MKKRLVAFAVIFVFLLHFLPAELSATGGGRKTADQEMRGVWVASVVNIDYPKMPTTNPLFLKREADLIIEQSYQTGINAIFLQVRPTSDALYDSDIFPWSKWLTGKEGLAPDDGFDPLEYFIEKAHAKGIEVHAWLNPYRITKRLSGEDEISPDDLTEGHPAKLHPEWVVSHEGNLYYDPALPEVRGLIADGVAEIVSGYDVDGIHFDDYFYPGTDFDDAASYEEYGNSGDKSDWRRQNVNLMVEKVRDTIKALDPDVEFGISPFGIWKNKTGDPSSNPYGIDGSDTRGNESYNAHYADSVYWVKNGLIDYINPQIYWKRGFEIADYNILSRWWSDVVKDTDVKLYIGHAAYKAGKVGTETAWDGPYEILEQVLLNRDLPEVDGSIFFSMRSLQQQPIMRKRLAFIYGVRSYQDLGIEPGIYLPYYDITTGMSVHYVGGLSDPAKPLYINGERIKNRSLNGFFGTLVDLDYGQNDIVLENGDATYVRTITRVSGSSDYGTRDDLPSAEIVEDSCYPKTQAIIRDGNGITFECTAPSGADVFAEVAGHKVHLERVWGNEEPSLYPAKYRGTFYPEQTFKHIEMYDYGRVTYNMYYKGVTDSKQSAAGFIYAADRSRFFAKVVEDEIDLRITKYPSDGSAEILDKGVITSLDSTDGDMSLLVSGRYTESENLSLIYALDDSFHDVKFSDYIITDEEDIIALELEDKYAIMPKFDGEIISVSIAGAGSVENLQIPDGAMISSSESKAEDARGYYLFYLKNPKHYNGVYVTYDEGKGFIHIRKRPGLMAGDKPLKGINIMLDPGHSAEDSGAIGLLGATYAEKHYNLDACNILKSQLEELGAEVTMTRTDDTDITLYDRLRMCYRQKPDMFISIHANSIGMHRDVSLVEGFSVYYSKALAKPFATVLQREIVEKTGRPDRKALTDDFYVIRATWAPSVLIEAGFMPNPEDFEWLYDKESQETYISEIVQSILMYFNDGGRR